MSAWTNLFCVLGLLFVFTRGTYAIDCYKCSITGCGDEFSSSAGGVTTQSNCDKCYKFKSEDSDTVERGCISTSVADGCTDDTIRGVTGTICYCSTNLCNSADQVTTSFMTSLVLGLCTLLANRVF